MASEVYTSNMRLLEKYHPRTWRFMREYSPMPVGKVFESASGTPNLEVQNNGSAPVILHDDKDPERRAFDFLKAIPESFRGLVAVLGHIHPLYLRFKGGKGAATGLGVIATLCPLAALLLVAVWVAVVSYYRMISLASLAVAWLMPLAVGLFSDSTPNLVVSGLISVLILFRHQDNIVRLVKGEEPPVVFSKKSKKPH